MHKPFVWVRTRHHPEQHRKRKPAKPLMATPRCQSCGRTGQALRWSATVTASGTLHIRVDCPSCQTFVGFAATTADNKRLVRTQVKQRSAKSPLDKPANGYQTDVGPFRV